MQLLLILLISILPVPTNGQTEGDIGYDERDFYDTEYDSASVLGKEPTFDTPLANSTAELGSTALLPCAIDYLGKYKVAWLEQNSIPLTYEERRVIDDSRFSIVRPMVRDWNLQLQDVRLDDAGVYRCTVNTKPIASKLVSLLVTVPASINKGLSSGNVTVQEGRDITITCSVFGIPQPEVTWYRHAGTGPLNYAADKQCHMVTDGNPRRHQQLSVHRPPTTSDWSDYRSRGTALVRGPTISFRNVSRFCGGVYECRADNGVSGPVNHRMRLSIEFAPEISLPNQRMGQSLGRETILLCSITAYPQAVSYWEKNGRTISSSNKHRIEAYKDDHALTLSLRIKDVDIGDYGDYNCVAANSLGRDQQTMTLFEYREHASNLPAVRNAWSSDRSQKTDNVAQSPSRQSAGVDQHQPDVIVDTIHKLQASERVKPNGVCGIYFSRKRHSAIAAGVGLLTMTSLPHLYKLL